MFRLSVDSANKWNIRQNLGFCFLFYAPPLCSRSDRQAADQTGRQLIRPSVDHAGRQAADHTGRQLIIQAGSWSGRQAADHTGRQLIRKADSWSDSRAADQKGRQLIRLAGSCSDWQAAVQTGRQPFRQDICECSVRGLLFFCSRSVCVSYFLRACLDYEYFLLMHSEYCKFKISTNFDVYSDGKFCWVRTEHMRNTNTPFEHKNSLYFAIKANKSRKF